MNIHLISIGVAQTAEQHLASSVPAVLVAEHGLPVPPVSVGAARSLVLVFTLALLQAVLVALHLHERASGAVKRAPADHEHHENEHGIADGEGEDHILRTSVIAHLVVVVEPDESDAQPNDLHHQNTWNERDESLLEECGYGRRVVGGERL